MRTISKIVQNWKEYLIKEYEPRLVTTPWIYHNPDLWLISLSYDWENRATIADKNLWATQVYNDWDTLTKANCWKMYQWWNNYWFDWNDVNSLTTSTTQVDASQYWPWNYYESSTFIISTSNPYDWDSSNNLDLWWWPNGTNEDRQWPCSTWFHIPTPQECENLWDVHAQHFWFSKREFRLYMKLPCAWLYKYDWTTDEINMYWDYWTCCKKNDWTSYMSALYVAQNSNTYTTYSEKQACALSIRPFKNEPVQPDESWIVLFQ